MQYWMYYSQENLQSVDKLDLKLDFKHLHWHKDLTEPNELQYVVEYIITVIKFICSCFVFISVLCICSMYMFYMFCVYVLCMFYVCMLICVYMFYIFSTYVLHIYVLCMFGLCVCMFCVYGLCICSMYMFCVYFSLQRSLPQMSIPNICVKKPHPVLCYLSISLCLIILKSTRLYIL